MARGVGRVVSARCWGRAGIAALLLSACGSAAAPRAVDVARPEPPVTFTGAAPPTVAPPRLAPGPAGSGTWAVVVGIDDYPGGGHDLRSAVNDAADVDTALERYGVAPDHRVALVDGQASAAVIARSLDWLVAHAGPDATAVVFFAGHVRKVGPGREALVGADGALVTDTQLADRLAGLRAARTWIVVAGCYGGGFTEALAPGRILTAAAPAGRLAFESPTLHRSYLVEYLVRRAMLEGRAGTSVEAAFAWASDALRREHPGRQPVQFDELPGDLVLGPAPVVVAVAAAPGPTSAPLPPTTATPTSAPAARTQRKQCVLTFGDAVRCPDD